MDWLLRVLIGEEFKHVHITMTVLLILQVAFVIGVLYVIVHFIQKFW